MEVKTCSHFSLKLVTLRHSTPNHTQCQSSCLLAMSSLHTAHILCSSLFNITSATLAYVSSSGLDVPTFASALPGLPALSKDQP